MGNINTANISCTINAQNIGGTIGMYKSANACNLKDIGVVRTNGIHNGKVAGGYSGTVVEIEEE